MGDPENEEEMSIGEKIALGVAIAVAAFGLFVVGASIFFALTLASWANNK